MSEIFGIVVTVIAVAGVTFNNRQSKWCFVFWMVSNFISALLHVNAGMWSLCLRDVIFFALCIEGFYLWSKRTSNSERSTPNVE